ncbi:MAG TPA: hypothetical protein VMV49_03605 [Candidatus Deferrimicrobium sp.]|nr:hypothetical protein [Candidatus Deferrimicrobium sp.]
MTKKEHVHVVTDTKHKEILENLGKKFGSMTKAFEHAIEILTKSEDIGSCENCEVKYEFEQANNFREVLNIISFSAENIRELIKFLRGDFTARDLLIRAREKAFLFGKEYYSFLAAIPENNYENLLATLEEYKKRTRFFKSIQVDSFAKKIITRVNVFEDLPIFVAMGILGYLESLDFTFDLEIFEDDIIFKWLKPETYLQEKTKIEDKISNYVKKSEKDIKSYFLKKGFILVSPNFYDWIAEHLDYHLIPKNLSYSSAKVLVGQLEDPSNIRQVAKLCEDILTDLNLVEEITSECDDEKKVLTLTIVCKTPNMPSLLTQGVIQIIAKYGWKLKTHQIDHKILKLKFNFVGEEDPSILDPLYILNFPAYFNDRYQKLRMISVDQYQDIMNALYHLDPGKFQEIIMQHGYKIANAIKLLANHDLKKMREIGRQIIPQLIKAGQRTPEEIDMLPELNKINIIYKKTDLVSMETLRYTIIAILEGFEYFDIKSKILDNVVVIEYKRPTDLQLVSSSAIK